MRTRVLAKISRLPASQVVKSTVVAVWDKSEKRKIAPRKPNENTNINERQYNNGFP